jgi:hypothetical protein
MRTRHVTVPGGFEGRFDLRFSDQPAPNANLNRLDYISDIAPTRTVRWSSAEDFSRV